jgi:hypothetical protein
LFHYDRVLKNNRTRFAANESVEKGLLSTDLTPDIKTIKLTEQSHELNKIVEIKAIDRKGTGALPCFWLTKGLQGIGARPYAANAGAPVPSFLNLSLNTSMSI